MDLRSGPPPGAPHCSPGGDGGEVDRISALPDDILLHVLARLRCARAAAATSLVSRRWRSLWRHLPELSFREISPEALLAALAQVARAELSACPSSTSTLALRLIVWGHWKDRGIPVEVPCFRRAESIRLGVWNLYLTLPAQAGEFAVLERLCVIGCPGINAAELISLCPRLVILELRNCWSLGRIVVHSPIIEELALCDTAWIRGIDIVAPVLKKFTLRTYMARDYSVSFSAPSVEDLSWSCLCDFQRVGIGEMWRLRHLDLCKEKNIYSLSLIIEIPQNKANTGHIRIPAGRSLMQDVVQLPEFSALKLSLATDGHIFGAMVLNLLGVCTSIKRLTVDIIQIGEDRCIMPSKLSMRATTRLEKSEYLLDGS
ncbi:hypothetical protein ACP70R_022968 [Stipagrostis hirtigluma subsp. patula]